MAVSQFLDAVRAQLSLDAKLLIDPSSKDFQQAYERWTKLSLKTPRAIVLVATEDDIVNTVKLATSYNVPFVAKAGGHSAWSTTEGVIIDLSNYNNITISPSRKTVRVQGGALNKQVIEALYAEKLVIPLGSGNTIGTIPQALGGGLCALTKLCGTTSDNIISARLITASGELQIVDASTPDLLWALKGAGQFFGLVTELEFATFPLEIIGASDGTVWTSTYIFDILQAQEVAIALTGLMDDEENNASVLNLISQHPMTRNPCVLTLASYFGSTADAEKFFSPIAALNPTMMDAKRVDYTQLNDGIDMFCSKGDFKEFNLRGISHFSPEAWGAVAQTFVDLTKECVDLVFGGYAFEFTTGKQKHIELDSAWAHRNVKVWIESLSWYTNPSSLTAVTEAERKALDLATAHLPASTIHTYQNFSRSSSLESRFGSLERVEKLKTLKTQWDPEGLFGGHLVESEV